MLARILLRVMEHRYLKPAPPRVCFVYGTEGASKVRKTIIPNRTALSAPLLCTFHYFHILRTMLHFMRVRAWAVALILYPFFSHLVEAATCPNQNVITNQLGKQLSAGSSISTASTDAPRWSLYGAPSPAYVVNVASEGDVAVIVSSNLIITGSNEP